MKLQIRQDVLNIALAFGTLLLGFLTWYDSRSGSQPEEPPEQSAASANGSPAPENRPANKEQPHTDPIQVASANRAKPATSPIATPDATAPGNNAGDASPHRRHFLELQPGKKMWFLSNGHLLKHNPGVKRVIICLTSHDPDLFFSQLLAAAAAEKKEQDSLFVMPLFTTVAQPPREGDLVWRDNWNQGGSAVNAPQIDAFMAIDYFLEAASRPLKFPNLESIVVAGQTVAALAVHHYAACGKFDLPQQSSASVSYVVIGAGSFVYVDKRRPAAGGGFQVPKEGQCADYNNYPYGLQSRWGALELLSDEEIRKNLTQRRAYYFVAKDDHDTTRLDRHCGAQLQGGDRYERAVNYWNYIQRFPAWSRNSSFEALDGPVALQHPRIRAVLFGTAGENRPTPDAAEAKAAN